MSRHFFISNYVSLISLSLHKTCDMTTSGVLCSAPGGKFVPFSHGPITSRANNWPRRRLLYNSRCVHEVQLYWILARARVHTNHPQRRHPTMCISVTLSHPSLTSNKPCVCVLLLFPNSDFFMIRFKFCLFLKLKIKTTCKGMKRKGDGFSLNFSLCVPLIKNHRCLALQRSSLVLIN